MTRHGNNPYNTLGMLISSAMLCVTLDARWCHSGSSPSHTNASRAIGGKVGEVPYHWLLPSVSQQLPCHRNSSPLPLVYVFSISERSSLVDWFPMGIEAAVICAVNTVSVGWDFSYDFASCLVGGTKGRFLNVIFVLYLTYLHNYKLLMISE